MWKSIVVTLLIIAMIQICSAVNCYNCDVCGPDLGTPDDCSTIKADEHFCRKIIDSAGTIYRHCSKKDSLPAGCYEVDGLLDCKCIGDGCNAASSNPPTWTFLTFFFVITKIFTHI